MITAVLRSEWIKARSTVGSLVTVPAGVLVSLGLALASGLSVREALDHRPELLAPGFNAINNGLYAFVYANLAFVIFAVLAVGSEFGTGTIRASLIAVPSRRLFLSAKLAVVAAVTLVLGGATVVLSFSVGESALGPHGASLAHPLALRAVLAQIAYAVLLSLFSAAVTVLVRGTAVALGILLPLFFAAGPLLANLPATRELARFLPDQAGQQAIWVSGNTLRPLYGLLVLILWTAAAVVAALWSIRRDIR